MKIFRTVKEFLAAIVNTTEMLIRQKIKATMFKK